MPFFPKTGMDQTEKTTIDTRNKYKQDGIKAALPQTGMDQTKKTANNINCHMMSPLAQKLVMTTIPGIGGIRISPLLAKKLGRPILGNRKAPLFLSR